MAYRITNFLGFSFLLGLSLSYILLYWLGYEVIRSPLSSIKEQTDHRKRRNLLLSLSEQIEEFFCKKILILNLFLGVFTSGLN